MPIVDLSHYKSRKELESYATSLFTQVAILQSKLAEIEAKELHARDLLKNSAVPDISSEEERLLIREIGYLDNVSRMGGLSLDETKQLNLLISCLVSIRKGEVKDDKSKKGASKLDKAKLLELVRAKSD